MKKNYSLFLTVVLVVLACIFVSCSAKNESAERSTTKVTDVNGSVHYYSPVTDSNDSQSKNSKNKVVFAEIVTDAKGRAVTEKNGNYVTNEHTTVLTAKDKTKKQRKTTGKNNSSSNKSSVHSTSKADNSKDNPNTDMKATTTAEETTTKHTSTTIKNENSTQSQEKTTTKDNKETEPATDKEGWITKWY